MLLQMNEKPFHRPRAMRGCRGCGRCRIGGIGGSGAEGSHKGNAGLGDLGVECEEGEEEEPGGGCEPEVFPEKPEVERRKEVCINLY